jgi:radical SAM superfamily enzyme YgiQ (UPF0313 family)
MKICFVQKQAFPYFGIMSLAGRLGAAGIESDVVITNLERDFISALKESAPDIIGISCLSTEHAWLKDTAERIKTTFPSTALMAGGIHAILYPETVLAIPAIDFVCTGEGEGTILALCSAIAEGSSVDQIKGIGYRRQGQPVLNGRETDVVDVNDSFEDRLVYYRRYALLREDELKQFISSRGCPYQCTFCFNQQLHRLFPAQKNRVRRKSPKHLVEEIERARATAPILAVFFADDLFTSSKKWLQEFVPLYRQRIGVPFMCITRADHLDDETGELLKRAGCHTVSFGIESGSEEIRTRLLRKQITDAAIIRCSDVLTRKGIRIQTSNMFCLPDETLEDALSTVKLNIRIKADFVFTPIFMPFPGTELAAYCIEKNYLPDDFGFEHLPQSFLRHSILALPDRKRIENVQRIAYFLVKYPALFRMAEPLVRHVRAAWCYYPFLFIGTLLRYKSERGISLAGAIRFLWRFRKSY